MSDKQPISYNPLKIRSDFQTKVNDAIKDGVKKACDTKEEYAALQQLLSGANEDEKKFVESKMKEYEEKYKLDDLKNHATEFVKNVVKNVKQTLAPKDGLNIEEARTLLNELKAAIDEGRANDVEYLRAELIQAGYEKELDDFENSLKPAKSEEKIPDKTNNEYTKPDKTEEAPKNSTEPNKPPFGIDKPKQNLPKNTKPSEKSGASNKSGDAKPSEKSGAPNKSGDAKPSEKSGAPNKSGDTKPKKTPVKITISKQDEYNGIDIANRVHGEAVKSILYADNEAIVKRFKTVTSDNAYTFFEQYIKKGGNIMTDVRNVSDIRNKIKFTDLKPAVDRLIEQAQQITGDDTVNKAVSTLKRHVQEYRNNLDSNGDLYKDQATKLDNDIKALVNAMRPHINYE